MITKRSILGLRFEAYGPSHYRLDLPQLDGRGEVSISYIDNREWVQFIALDGQVASRIYSTLEDAVRPLAKAFHTI